MDPYKQEYTTLGIAAAGCYATAPNPWSKDSAASITIYDRRLTAYLGELVEGGIVIDKRPCVNRDDFVSMVVSGPMLQESLPHDTKRGWDSTEPCTLEQAREAKGFDYLSLNLYIQVWAEKGARIGVRVGDKVYWNDGPLFGWGIPQDIPPAELRYQCDS